VIAALSLVFTVIATLVGTYFGIKATGDARDTVENIARQTTDAATHQMAHRAEMTGVPRPNPFSCSIGPQGGYRRSFSFALISYTLNSEP
jgi:hypothetical protein